MRESLLILVSAFVLSAQTQGPPATPGPANPAGVPTVVQAPNQGQDELMKHVDDLMWHVLLGDIADIDKDEYTSLPLTHIPNPKAPGAANPLIIRAYTFIP